MAFYKKEANQILCGDNFVFSPIVTLKAENKDNYIYPQDGWYWCDSFDDALALFAKQSIGSNSITGRQARLKLLEMGLLFQVNIMLESNESWKIEWEYANEIFRNSPLIAGIASQLGMSSEQLDDLFIEASKL